MMDQIRFFVEECDHLQGFVTICDVDSGFGSFCRDVLTRVHDELTTSPVMLFAPVTRTKVNLYTELLAKSSQASRHLPSNIAQSLVELKELCAVYTPLAVDQWSSSHFPLLNPNVRVMKQLHSTHTHSSILTITLARCWHLQSTA